MKHTLFSFRQVLIYSFVFVAAIIQSIAQTNSSPDLFFSEYIEGSSFNKAVEIYNGTGSDVDLSTYSLELYSNGNSSPNSTQALSGTLAAGDVYVVANAQADAAILSEADLTSSVINFNGDDAFVLKNTDAIIDVIGQIGFDPGTSWSGNGVSTQNATIRRKASVTAGDTNGSDAFDPSIEWDGFPINTFDDLGSFGDDSTSGSDLFFSEYIEGSSFNKAVEIYNGTGSDVDLSTYSLELYSNGNSSPNSTQALSGTLAAGDVYVVANAQADAAILSEADLTSSVINFNGDDAFVLKNTDAIIDVIGQIGFDPGTSWSGNGVSTQNVTIRRKASVTAGDTNGSDAFDPSIEWDGFPINTFDDLGSFGDDSTSGSDLFFSEYIEGSSFNKAVEIYNGTGSDVDLSTYSLELYSNGNSSPNSTQALSGTLAAGDVYVVANAQADAAILSEADFTSSVINFNGDDAFVLKNTNAIIDVIGQIGFDPGTSWSGNGVSTQNATIRRKASVTAGDTNGSDAFDPSIEWDGFPINTFDDLGSFGDDSTSGSDLFFSEYIEGSSFNKAVEIYNGTGSDVDLSTYSLELYSNGNSSPNSTQALSGTLAAGDVYVVANALADAAILSEADLTSSVINFNGDDAFVLKNTDAIIDVIGQIGFDPGASWSGNGVSTQNATIRRKASVTTGDTNGSDAFDPSIEWDGFPNDSFDDLGSFGGGSMEPVIVKIHEVQGADESSPIIGQTVTIEGIVVGDFQGPDDVSLSGFFVQEEDIDNDNDPNSSEGIFVFEGDNNSPIVDISVGDLVRVTGTVSEAFGQTQISGSVAIEALSSSNTLPSASILQLPVSDLLEFEALEGMYVQAKGNETVGKLTVTEFFNFDRFGEVLLSAGGQLNGRFMQYTQVNAPDIAGFSSYSENLERSTITIDDGKDGQNFIPEVNGAPISNDNPLNTIRGGDQLDFVYGVLSFAFSKYRIHPTEAVNYTSTNPRPTQRPTVAGNLKVASFNVLNFFNGDGMGGGFPTSRGARTLSDFERQATKIVEALAELDADIVGLQEIENDGFDSESAIQELIDLLNAKVGQGTYDYVDLGVSTVGTDEITVGMIYKPSKVTEIGNAVYLDDSSLPNGFAAPLFDGVNTNRNPIAQTFRINTASTEGLGSVITIAVNHFKSKGGNGSGPDADQGDGQGNWNQRRTEAANAIAAWLSGYPTGVIDDDILIVGDLNAYSQEDPVQALLGQGYVNAFSDPLTYSFVFDGQWGSLDYALSSPTLAGQLSGAEKWNVNADELDAWDYSSRFNDPALYAPDFYRNSDHDPLIVGFDLETDLVSIGDCEVSADEVFGAATIIDAAPLTFRDFSKYNRRGRNYATGVITGITDEGKAAVWEVQDDCSVNALRKIGFRRNQIELPQIFTLPFRLGWEYIPQEISEDGKFIYAVAHNEAGYSDEHITIDPNTSVDIKFRIGRPFFGRISNVYGFISCDASYVRVRRRPLAVGCGSSQNTTIPENKEGISISLSVYPNPAHTKMSINVEGENLLNDSLMEIGIINLKSGTLIMTEKLVPKTTTLDISGLDRGVYVLKATLGGKSFNLRFIK